MEAKHELAKLLNENFRAAVDYHMVQTYSSEGYDRLVMRAGTDDEDAIYFAAKAECKNFIRRCRRACKKAGIEFRYAFVTSDRDGDTLEPVRVHHHLVVNAEAAAICIEKWMEGEVRKPKELYGDKYGDLTALAEYMIAQVRYFPGEKRYTPSRNLRKVEPGALIKARNPEAELRVPKGCKLIYRSENYVGRPQYVRYYRPKADKLREAKGQNGRVKQNE